MSFLLKKDKILYIIKIGDDMKKILGILIILFVAYLGLQVAFNIFSNGHEYDYVTTTNGTNYNIKEVKIHNVAGELDNYYFEIDYNNKKFLYQTLQKINSPSHVIENIYSYNSDNYTCVLPIFDGGLILTDIMCNKDNVIYYYHDLVGNEASLDSFAESLTDTGYDKKMWTDDATSKVYDNISVYKSNIQENHYLTLTNYKGVYIVDAASTKNIDLFDKDNYKQPLSVLAGKFYVVADYNTQYRFHKFIKVNVTNGNIDDFTFEHDISFDSYIQGVHNNSFYLFDKDNKKQYEVTPTKNTVLEVGNEQDDIKIYNGNEVTRIKVSEAKNNTILFDNQEYKLDNQNYDKLYKIGGDKSGFYYMFKKEGDKYKVYRANVQSPNQITYLFDSTDINRIIYKDDYIYYINNDTIYYFSDKTSSKKVIQYNELQFNNSLTFSLYTE